jgi:PTH1 family peptidyl-tRNA hydrolase
LAGNPAGSQPGNPGPRYERTRHNAGFLVLERLRGAARWVSRGNFQEAEARLGDRSVILARPLTFMNLSGEAAEAVLVRHTMTPGELLVAADDIALPFGRLRIRTGGGPGGHRGLVSIAERIGTYQFPRLRAGIGPLPPETDLAEFVLRPLSSEEWPTMDRMLERAAEAARVLCLEGTGAAMNRFNPPFDPGRLPAPPG